MKLYFQKYLGLMVCLPVKQQVQHLFGGGEGPVGAEEDGDVGGVVSSEGGDHVLHQTLQSSCFNGAQLTRLVQTEARV